MDEEEEEEEEKEGDREKVNVMPCCPTLFKCMK